MPELPEVETVRLGLIPAVEGHVLARVQARRADLRVAFPSRFAERLTGRGVLRLRRRAKYLLLDLDSGETLVMHLGMSGRLTIHGAKAFGEARPRSITKRRKTAAAKASTITSCSRPRKARASCSPIIGVSD